jgi:ribonuclease-3
MGFINRVFSRGNHSEGIDKLVKEHFNLKIGKRDLYEEAIRHSSVLDGDTSGKKSNERLEYLGDAVLDLCVADYLHKSDKKAAEGLLTQRKSRVVNRKNLNRIGKAIGLEDLLQVKMRRDDIRDNMVGNAIEALIGAIYEDHGYVRTYKSVVKLLKLHGIDQRIHETTDFKSKLHHWAQVERIDLKFEVIREYTESGEGKYEVEVLADGERIGLGSGRSKKIAEHDSARRGWRTVFEKNEKENGEGENSL